MPQRQAHRCTEAFNRRLLSASSISRLTQAWQDEHAAFKRRRLDFVRYAYLFCDGVHVKVRLGEEERLCLLVVIGVREDPGARSCWRSRTATASRPTPGRTCCAI
jgi:transposase-like protein